MKHTHTVIHPASSSHTHIYTYVTSGDDTIELWQGNTVVDVFGDITTDGTQMPWEYLDGWAYRVAGTGPDGSTFNVNSWTYSGVNSLDDMSSNIGNAAFPLG